MLATRIPRQEGTEKKFVGVVSRLDGHLHTQPKEANAILFNQEVVNDMVYMMSDSLSSTLFSPRRFQRGGGFGPLGGTAMPP